MARSARSPTNPPRAPLLSTSPPSANNLPQDHRDSPNIVRNNSNPNSTHPQLRRQLSGNESDIDETGMDRHQREQDALLASSMSAGGGGGPGGGGSGNIPGGSSGRRGSVQAALAGGGTGTGTGAEGAAASSSGALGLVIPDYQFGTASGGIPGAREDHNSHGHGQRMNSTDRLRGYTVSGSPIAQSGTTSFSPSRGGSPEISRSPAPLSPHDHPGHGPSSSPNAIRHSSLSHGPGGLAGRFCRQHRNLSDTSVDSQPAFIDHRSHPMGISPPGGGGSGSGGIGMDGTSPGTGHGPTAQPPVFGRDFARMPGPGPSGLTSQVRANPLTTRARAGTVTGGRGTGGGRSRLRGQIAGNGANSSDSEEGDVELSESDQDGQVAGSRSRRRRGSQGDVTEGGAKSSQRRDRSGTITQSPTRIEAQPSIPTALSSSPKRHHSRRQHRHRRDLLSTDLDGSAVADASSNENSSGEEFDEADENDDLTIDHRPKSPTNTIGWDNKRTPRPGSLSLSSSQHIASPVGNGPPGGGGGMSIVGGGRRPSMPRQNSHRSAQTYRERERDDMNRLPPSSGGLGAGSGHTAITMDGYSSMLPGPHNDLSRRPSLIGRPEEDVCFPMELPTAHGGQSHGHEGQPRPHPHVSPETGAHMHGDLGQFEDRFQHPMGMVDDGGGPQHPGQRGIPGVLPGFPYAFDFEALEEYARNERDELAKSGFGSSANGYGNGSGIKPTKFGSPGVNTGNEPISVTFETTKRRRKSNRNRGDSFGVHDGEDDANKSSWLGEEGNLRGQEDQTLTRRKKTPNRKLSESIPAGGGSGRHQKKLALFEGGGPGDNKTSGAGGDGAGTGTTAGGGNEGASFGNAAANMFERAKSTLMDAKTPLLDPARRSSSQPQLPYGATSSGSKLRRKDSGATGVVGDTGVAESLREEKPYRFSFYSNALPSTIHARYLSEIPAESQTFEELFVGRPPPPPTPYEQSAPAPPPPDSAGGGNGGGRFSSSRAPTGANTPDGSERNGWNGNANGTSNGNGNGHTGGNSSARSSGLNQAQYNQMAPLQSMPSTAPGFPRHLLAGMKGPGIKPGMGMIRTDGDAEANTWWLDVLCPTDAEMKVLSKAFGIHPLTTEDVLMEETREKIELFRNYYLVSFRSFDQDPYSQTYLEALNMYIIVFREGTLSFHFRAAPHPQNVRRRIKQLKDYINVTADWISYALIDDITDAFGPLIQGIEYEVDSVDELVLILKETEQSDMLRRIGTCRKKVMGLLRLMGNKADVVKGLAKRCNENWSVAPKSDIGLYLSDIQDHLITMTQNLNHYEKILSRSHSNYLAQISIEMTDANNQINDVLSKLTALGSILLPMNLITGLWGMNVNVPGQDVENLHWFFSILGVMAAIAIGGAWVTFRLISR